MDGIGQDKKEVALKKTVLERKLDWVLKHLFSTTPIELQDQAMAFLAPLKYKSHANYEHCIRVGLLVNDITKSVWNLGRVGCWDAFVAGLLHDVGKALIDSEVLLRSTSGVFTDSDRQEMHEHAIYGYKLLRGTLGFTPDIVVRHHRFQNDPYPEPLPLPPYTCQWPDDIKQYIEKIAELISLADCYDALHRDNSRFATGRRLTGEEIKQKLLELKSNQRELIERLYSDGILVLTVLSIHFADAFY